ncbi:MAG: HEAT repeat domain-containing protein [Proteobacteria bacterium]|nr:HEAT repeat domain-containing protein [Pseudomonadota bacterium]
MDTLLSILTDFSNQRTIHPPNIGIAPVPAGSQVRENLLGAYKRNSRVVRDQITADRYYAVHLLGELRDARAVGALLPLLDDDQINYKVAWALGEIGDHRAIQGLIAALSNSDALVRVSAIEALEELRAGAALPFLVAMFDDKAVPRAGDRISVGVTARRAADMIRGGAVPRR